MDQLPAGAKPTGVTRFLHDGTEKPYEFTADPLENRVRLYIEDSASSVCYDRTRYASGECSG